MFAKFNWKDEIVSLFSKYGKIKKLVLPTEKTGSNKGYAFITYENFDSVNSVFKDRQNVKVRAKIVI